MVARHSGRGVAWRPINPRLSPAVELLRQSAATGLTCSDLADAALAVAAGAKAVTVLIPPVVGEGPERLAMLARTAAVRVVCDHFAQAEPLASALHKAGTIAELLLRVDPGRQRLGVRPGPDLKDLAQGVARLSGLRLVGLFVEDRSNSASGVSRLTPAELAGLLRGCRSSLERAGHKISTVSIGRLRDITGSESDSSVTEARTPLSRNAGDSLAVVAGVVGRPTRDQAIIDAGRRLLGQTAVVAVPGRAGIRPVAIEDEITVLRLEGSARDLAVGDVVSLLAQGGSRLPQQTSLLVHNGDRWRIAAG